MYGAGVVCSDCHNPHSLELKLQGNALCGQCHAVSVFDAPDHTFHDPGTPGSQCVDCHMPAKTYMTVDPRRDHSFNIPRPDLSMELGVPNACASCHAGKSSRWAADAVMTWYPNSEIRSRRAAAAIAAGRLNRPGAGQQLAALAASNTSPIVRATAVSMLGSPNAASSGRDLARVIEQALHDPEGMVRMAGLLALAIAPDAEQRRLGLPLLSDSLLAVRLEAVNLLAPLAGDVLNPGEYQTLTQGVAEYEAAQMVNSDRPEAHINLGVLYTNLSQLTDAEQSYRRALRVDPRSIEARVNLADLFRIQGRETEGESILREALAIDPDNPGAAHALGLLLVRQQKLDQAIGLLELASRNAPGAPRYAYVYAVALNSTGRPDDALAIADAALTEHPYDRELLALLVSLHREANNLSRARPYMQRLQELGPATTADFRSRR